MTTTGQPTELQIDVARRILELLGRRRLAVGTHLTAQSLADELQVSRSPVRGALTYLAERGFLDHQSQRGYFLRRDGRELQPEAIELPKTTDEQLCVRVAKDWFEDRVPRQFTEAEFRRRYGLGRLTASRTLMRLSEQGIIARVKGHGWQFLSTLGTRAAHDESYKFRLIIEPEAILCDTFELDRGRAEVSRRRHESVLYVDPDESMLTDLFEIDAAFHQLIGVSSNNRFFQEAIERQNVLRRVVEYESLLDRDRFAGSCAEHMKILDALEAGDRQRAAGEMRDHLRLAHGFAPDYAQVE